MGLYEETFALDIVTPIMGKLPITFTQNGEPKVHVRWEGAPNSPWINNLRGTDRCCPLWNNNYFEYYKFIPRGCRSCWKVVMVVPNVRQLLRLEEWQRN